MATNGKNSNTNDKKIDDVTQLFSRLIADSAASSSMLTLTEFTSNHSQSRKRRKKKKKKRAKAKEQNNSNDESHEREYSMTFSATYERTRIKCDEIGDLLFTNGFTKDKTILDQAMKKLYYFCEEEELNKEYLSMELIDCLYDNDYDETDCCLYKIFVDDLNYDDKNIRNKVYTLILHSYVQLEELDKNHLIKLLLPSIKQHKEISTTQFSNQARLIKMNGKKFKNMNCDVFAEHFKQCKRKNVNKIDDILRDIYNQEMKNWETKTNDKFTENTEIVMPVIDETKIEEEVEEEKYQHVIGNGQEEEEFLYHYPDDNNGNNNNQEKKENDDYVDEDKYDKEGDDIPEKIKIPINRQEDEKDIDPLPQFIYKSVRFIYSIIASY